MTEDETVVNCEHRADGLLFAATDYGEIEKRFSILNNHTLEILSS